MITFLISLYAAARGSATRRPKPRGLRRLAAAGGGGRDQGGQPGGGPRWVNSGSMMARARSHVSYSTYGHSTAERPVYLPNLSPRAQRAAAACAPARPPVKDVLACQVVRQRHGSEVVKDVGCRSGSRLSLSMSRTAGLVESVLEPELQGAGVHYSVVARNREPGHCGYRTGDSIKRD
jgi:hypothetical protein